MSLKGQTSACPAGLGQCTVPRPHGSPGLSSVLQAAPHRPWLGSSGPRAQAWCLGCLSRSWMRGRGDPSTFQAEAQPVRSPEQAGQPVNSRSEWVLAARAAGDRGSTCLGPGKVNRAAAQGLRPPGKGARIYAQGHGGCRGPRDAVPTGRTQLGQMWKMVFFSKGKGMSNTEVQTVIPRGGGQAGDRWGGNTEAEVGLGDDVVILGQNSGFMGACSIFQ